CIRPLHLTTTTPTDIYTLSLHDALPIFNPVETVRTNTLGNTVILEASRQARIRRFVFASTLYVYSQSGAFYRSSKQACELIIEEDRKSTRLNSSHVSISYAVFCLKKKKQ